MAVEEVAVPVRPPGESLKGRTKGFRVGVRFAGIVTWIRTWMTMGIIEWSIALYIAKCIVFDKVIGGPALPFCPKAGRSISSKRIGKQRIVWLAMLRVGGKWPFVHREYCSTDP